MIGGMDKEIAAVEAGLATTQQFLDSLGVDPDEELPPPLDGADIPF